MNFQKYKAQKLAVKNGLLLGSVIFILNCILTFIYVDASTHNAISYAVVPFIVLFAGYTGYQRMKQTHQVEYAIQSSILTVTIGLLIGFGSLYLLTFLFMDIVKNNPLTVQNFRDSGSDIIENFVYKSIMLSITTSVPVSIILGIISGAIGAVVRNKHK